MKKEEVAFLVQLVNTLEIAEERLEGAYNRKDYNQFNRLKRFVISVNDKIAEVLSR